MGFAALGSLLACSRGQPVHLDHEQVERVEVEHPSYGDEPRRDTQGDLPGDVHHVLGNEPGHSAARPPLAAATPADATSPDATHEPPVWRLLAPHVPHASAFTIHQDDRKGGDAPGWTPMGSPRAPIR